MGAQTQTAMNDFNEETLEVSHSGIHPVDRRNVPDDKRRDRRIIARVSNPTTKSYFKQTLFVCRLIGWLSVIYVIGLIVAHLHGSNLVLTRSIFFGTVVTIISYMIFSFASAIDSYLKNESQSKLAIVSEKCFQLFLVLGSIALILSIANMVTWF